VVPSIRVVRAGHGRVQVQTGPGAKPGRSSVMSGPLGPGAAAVEGPADLAGYGVALTNGAGGTNAGDGHAAGLGEGTEPVRSGDCGSPVRK
jgi:hypothetical protein